MAFIAVVVTFIALTGAVLPFLMGRQDRETLRTATLEIELGRRRIADMEDHATRHLETVKAQAQIASGEIGSGVHRVAELEALAKKHIDDIQSRKKEADIATARIQSYVPKFVNDEPLRPNGEPDSIIVAASELLNNDSASFDARLRAEAIVALTNKQIEEACLLWKLVTDRNPTDANAYLGLGLSLQAKAALPAGTEKKRTIYAQIYSIYAQALLLNPNLYEAANNWGNALTNEAKLVADLDLFAARAIWRSAGDKYALALQLKPDEHEVTHNWGIALALEADALISSDFPAARTLMKSAGDKYEKALYIKPEMLEAVSNWTTVRLREYRHICRDDPVEASILLEGAEALMQRFVITHPKEIAYKFARVYALRNKVVECLNWLEVAREKGSLPDEKHIQADADFAVIRDSHEFQVWRKKTFG